MADPVSIDFLMGMVTLMFTCEICKKRAMEEDVVIHESMFQEMWEWWVSILGTGSDSLND